MIYWVFSAKRSYSCEFALSQLWFTLTTIGCTIEGHPITATRVRLAQFLGLCAGFDNCPLTDTCVINQLWQSLGRLNYAPNCRAHTHIIRCLLSHSSLSFFLTLPAGPAFNTKRCLKQQKSNLQHNCCHIIHQIWHKRKIALQWEEFGRAKGRGDTVPWAELGCGHTIFRWARLCEPLLLLLLRRQHLRYVLQARWQMKIWKLLQQQPTPTTTTTKTTSRRRRMKSMKCFWHFWRKVVVVMIIVIIGATAPLLPPATRTTFERWQQQCMPHNFAQRKKKQ